MKKRFLFQIISLLVFISLYANDQQRTLKEYSIDFYDSRNGLPQNSVLAIEQTPDGYLWLGTFEGLARFDGVRFKIYDKSNTPEFVNTSIKCLLSDSQGRLWIGTPNGLLVYEKGHFTRFGEKDGLESEFILAIYEDVNHKIWLGTTKGAAYYAKGQFVSLTVEDGFPTEFVNAISGDDKGNIWFGTDDRGLSYYNRRGFFNFDLNSGLTSLNIRALVYDRDDDVLWVGTGGGGLLSFKNGSFNHIKNKKLRHADIRALYLDKNKTLWIATNSKSIMTLKNGVLDYLSDQSVYSTIRTRDIMKDREGSIWVGTRKGLMRLREDIYIVYNSQNGLPVNPVRSVFEDRDKNVWIGTVGGGVVRFDGKIFHTFNTSLGLPDNKVWTITQDNAGAMWFGTYGDGVMKMKSRKRFVYNTKNGLNNDVVRVVYKDSRNRIWVGTNGGGINIIDGTNVRSLTTRDGLSDNYVYAIKEDKDHNFWIGTYSGDLNRYQNGEFTVFLPPKNETKNAIWAIYPDDEGNIWMGTDHGGLIRFKDGQYKRYTVQDGMYHDQAFQILEDDEGYLWMNCNRGIYVVKKSDFDRYDAGQIKQLTCISYGKEEGIYLTESSGPAQPAGWIAHDHKIWFATINGVIVFDKKGYDKNKIPPPVVIESVLDKGVRHDIYKDIILAPGHRDLEIHYTALSYLNPNKVTFKYKLDGYDKVWINAFQRRTAYYTALEPGEYSFQVIAANNDGLWNNKGARIKVTILPSLYETALFRFIVVLILLLIAYGIYRLRVMQLVRHKSKLENEIHERTNELNKANEELATTNETLEYLAQYDALTQIPNHKNFIQFFEGQWRLAYREKHPLTLIIIDIDNFKSYNDNYGHLLGDNCLKEVARVLADALRRPTDFIARYGGEEFVIVLPNTDEEGGFTFAEQIRNTVIDRKIPHDFSEIEKFVTISLGYSSCIPEDDHSLNRLIRKADEALLGAKESGKNKVGYVGFKSDTE